MKKTKFDFQTIFQLVNFTLYLGCVVYALLAMVLPLKLPQPAHMMLLQTIQALAFLLVPFLVEKLFKVKMSLTARILIDCFAFGAIFCGQILRLYDSVSWWDVLMHSISGVLLFFFGLSLASYHFDRGGKPNKFGLLLFACMFAFGVAALWEVAEFTTDSLFHADSQRYIPENELYNGGDGSKPLNGTPEEIAEFYSRPEGYRYALMDTMTDVICGCAGCAVGLVIVISLRKSSTPLYSLIKKKEEREQV